MATGTLASAQTPVSASTKTSINSGALPSMGENAELTAAAERRIGDRIAASIYRDPDYVDDPVLEDYMQGIWQPLMEAARVRGDLHAELQERFAWNIFLIRDRSVNAFALPGGYFGVHLGLISLGTSRDELAAVLGHELSHVTQRHIARLITQQTQQAPWLIGALILGALAAGKNPQLGNAAIVGGQAAAVQSQLNFSRDMEREADRVGFGVMTDAGFESRGVASMFEKLQQAARLNDNGSFPYLRSHPLSTQRIAEVQARLQLQPKAAAGPNKATDEESAKAQILYAMMAARARVLADPGVDALHTMVEQAQRLSGVSAMAASAVPVPTSVAPLSASAYSRDARSADSLYAGALAAGRLRDFALAQSFTNRLKPLAAGDLPAAKVIDLLALELDLLAGKVPAQAERIDLVLATSRADVLLGAQALLAAGRAQAVSGRLQTWVTANPKDARAWQLLAVAYSNLNQRVRSIRADGEARVAQLDYAGALERFKAAQTMMHSNSGSADFVEGSIIDTRVRQMDLLVKEQALQDKLDR
ncbi:MAG: M48 family metalloprotease [Polaromonas sp.]|nr:M48 family metalloprotease [Polaromonas sp.]